MTCGLPTTPPRSCDWRSPARPLDEPIAVCTIIRPEWVIAVANEHGVMDVPLAEALATYAETYPALTALDRVVDGAYAIDFGNGG